MGEVWAVDLPGPPRVVKFSRPKCREWGEDEARVLLLVQGEPGWPEVWGWGVDPVMGPWVGVERLGGEDIHDAAVRRYREIPVPADVASRWTAGAARGLAALHRLGIVHMDVKPENLWERGNGEVVVLDPGIALCPWEDRNPCRGSLQCASPEARLGERERIRGAADVWSLGVVLHRWLAGRYPYRADLLLLPPERRDHTPLPKSADPWLADLADWMLAYRPADRPSMAEVAELAAA